MAEEESGFDEPEPFAEPNPLKENMPLYALYGATGYTVLLFLGTFIWLKFPSEAIEAELRAMRLNLTKKVPSLRRSARGAAAEKAVATEGEDDDKPRVPSAPTRKSAVLHPHPDPQLVERADIGMLPIVGAAAAGSGMSIRDPSTCWKSDRRLRSSSPVWASPLTQLKRWSPSGRVR